MTSSSVPAPLLQKEGRALAPIWLGSVMATEIFGTRHQGMRFNQSR